MFEEIFECYSNFSKGLLGLQGSSGSGFVETIKFVVTRFHELRPSDALLGVGSIAILLLMRVSTQAF